ncbi:hypothetical protein [Burkholderia oklahomensis]|uniref:hypothetical protein n=1 Tax=Burkholderia oklahomensis TaxID=342113 RepID=UPI000F539A0E|nr:hypothetical protein [Burkholderia oklahomensis]MBI0363261.1 hypothetical protein [Burkholderia oklahomensis]
MNSGRPIVRASSERDARKRMQVCCIPAWPKRLARPNLKVRIESPRGATFIAVGTGCGKPRRKQPEDAVTGCRDRVRTGRLRMTGCEGIVAEKSKATGESDGNAEPN